LKGTYILLICLEKDTEIPVGSLGTLFFKHGMYCYVGSAYGPGGIEARVKRHIKKEKRMRWHIDYLLKHAEVKEVFVKENGDEVGTAGCLSEMYNGVPGFGASDSPLKSHLFMCSDTISLSELGFTPYP